MRKPLRTITAGALTVTAVLVCGTARATPPGPGVSGRTISRTTIGHTDYTWREVTIPVGQGTGWHYHDGPLYGIIKQGTLSHFDSTCASDGVYPQGSTILEPAGPGNIHLGQNLGCTPVVLDILYVLPHGSPFSEDAPNPGCGFQ
ncbi:hypothetical protein [Streptomyces graminilatus]|uniref:hypothetical protein n=1 Tax=Streptomyces graminilatus TaxID=1464070 RepID=UPI0006E34DD0|nr:hypothetical protein [Streptomyces graminilatus]